VDTFEINKGHDGALSATSQDNKGIFVAKHEILMLEGTMGFNFTSYIHFPFRLSMKGIVPIHAMGPR
jgi:hypothetical protein